MIIFETDTFMGVALTWENIPEVSRLSGRSESELMEIMRDTYSANKTAIIFVWKPSKLN